MLRQHSCRSIKLWLTTARTPSQPFHHISTRPCFLSYVAQSSYLTYSHTVTCNNCSARPRERRCYAPVSCEVLVVSFSEPPSSAITKCGRTNLNGNKLVSPNMLWKVCVSAAKFQCHRPNSTVLLIRLWVECKNKSKSPLAP
jgi:hypothetical protein